MNGVLEAYPARAKVEVWCCDDGADRAFAADDFLCPGLSAEAGQSNRNAHQTPLG
jgi:hypothetical protein